MGVGLSASSSGGKLEATGLSNYIDLTIASKGVGEVYVHTDSTKRMTVQGDGKVSIGNVGEITSSETLYVAGSVNLVSGSSYQVNGVDILSNIPQSAITNLSTDLSNKQDLLTFGNAAGNAMKVGNNAIAQDSFVRRGSAGHFYGSSVSATQTALGIKTATFVIHCEESHGVNPNDTNGFQWSYGNGDTNNYGLALPCKCTLRRYAISTEKSIQFMFQVYKFTNTATLPAASTLGIKNGANCYGYLGSAAHAGAGTFRKALSSTHNSGTQTALDIQYNDDGVQELDFNAGDRIALRTEFLMNPTTEFNNFGARITLQFDYVSDT
jgi:hypothetical protein